MKKKLIIILCFISIAYHFSKLRPDLVNELKFQIKFLFAGKEKKYSGIKTLDNATFIQFECDGDNVLINYIYTSTEAEYHEVSQLPDTIDICTSEVNEKNDKLYSYGVLTKSCKTSIGDVSVIGETGRYVGKLGRKKCMVYNLEVVYRGIRRSLIWRGYLSEGFIDEKIKKILVPVKSILNPEYTRIYYYEDKK